MLDWKEDGFNPYSPGFSIYLTNMFLEEEIDEQLQSLFTWIFYLFNKLWKRYRECKGCFNPYSPGFSIYLIWITTILMKMKSFNPYSPGFSIYLAKHWSLRRTSTCFNPYSPGFSIYLQIAITRKVENAASILIHLDFLSIY